MSRIGLVAGGIALLGAGCSRPESKKPFVARVNDAVLTTEQLRERVGNDSAEAAPQYVAAWIIQEMLYQEAQRRGLADNEELRRQLDDARRQFAIAALLEREVYSADTIALSDDTLRQAFEANRESYRLREDVAQISFAIFGEREAANNFRAKLLRGTPWPAALDSVKAELPDAVLRSTARAFFTQATLYPEELWKATRALRKDDVSYTIRTEAGYAVMIVHATKAQGETPDFEFVREEVRSRLLLEKRRERYNTLIARLRSQHNIDVHRSANQNETTE